MRWYHQLPGLRHVYRSRENARRERDQARAERDQAQAERDILVAARRALANADIVYLVGSAGQMNYGDERIAISWIKYIAAQRPTDTIYVDCHNPSSMSDYLGISGLRAYPVSHLIEAATASASDRLTTIDQHFELGLRHFDDGAAIDERQSAFYAVVDRVRIVHFHGGGYMNSIWPHMAYAFGAAVALKRMRGVRLYATGLGVMPLTANDAQALALCLAEFDFVEFRDEDSHRTIAATFACPHAVLGLDDTFLDQVTPQLQTRRPPTLHLCLQADIADEQRRQTLLERVCEYLRRPDSTISEVRYYIFNPGSDEFVYQAISDAATGQKSRKVSFADLMNGEIDAYPGDLAIVTRFHAHLFLARLGVKGFYYPVKEGYYDVKHQSLRAVGSTWQLLDLAMPIDFQQLDSARGKFVEDALVAQKRGVAKRLYDDKATRVGAAL